MTKKLRISPDLALPPDAATSTIVVYGGKGMGKTNLASVLVEEFAGAGIRFAVIDPMGVWWGLRHGADGKSAGVEVLILGGIHGDLPITPESGVLVADLVVDEDASVIIDISRRADGSMWSIAERVRFVTAYAKRVYQRQGEKRRPINQVIDEAARFAPQIVRQGESEVAACMGAIAVLVEEGRNVGIGVALVTQRSARLNKDVAELADCMIAFRIVGPNSMRAVLDWLGEHVDKARLKEIGEKLRSLPRGSALVVSPGWLEFEGIVAMRKRTTFDSSATPKPGEQVRASGTGAKPDLAKYRERLAELVEQQKANDPKALKAEVARLTKANAVLVTGAERSIQAQLGKAKTVEKPAMKDAQVKRIEAVIAAGDKAVATAASLADRAGGMMKKAAELMAASAMRVELELAKFRDVVAAVRAPLQTPAPARTKVNQPAPRPTPATRAMSAKPLAAKPPASTDERIGTPEMRVLNAIAWWQSIGIESPVATAVAFLAGYTSTSSSFERARGALRAAGLIDFPTQGSLRMTGPGAAIATLPDTPLDNAAMHAAVMARLGGPERKVLQPVIDAYPAAVAQEQAAESAGYSHTSSSFERARGALRTFGLIEFPRAGDLRATDLLFPEGA